jgi:hypothetical protein
MLVPALARRAMTIPTDDFLPVELASLVDAELAKGERVIWVGQPIPWRFARSSIPTVLLGIPFTAFACFWIAAASGFRFPDFSKPQGLFPLFGVLFVLVGLGMLLSPLWMLYRAGRIVYAVTDRRALVIERGILGQATVRSFEPARLTDVTRIQYADGSGNLVFLREYRPDRRYGADGRRGRFVEVGFLAVPDVKEVEDRIRELVGKAGDSSGGPGSNPVRQ